jgi:hypothetical protein
LATIKKVTAKGDRYPPFITYTLVFASPFQKSSIAFEFNERKVRERVGDIRVTTRS